jgi:hypothetical protein
MSAVAATGTWRDPDNVRRPAGVVHAWRPGTNQTVCGLALSKSQLTKFPGTEWAEVQPATGIHADEVTEVCRRCAAGMGARRKSKPWQRIDPRP